MADTTPRLLENKIALVTGGSRGIGKDIVLKLAAQGASVYYLSQSEGPHADEFATAASENGVFITHKQGSVADAERVDAVVKEILDESEGVDILINNAGITRDGLIMRMSNEDWQQVLDINLTGTFYLCRALTRSMLRRRSGSIINVSSIVGLIGNGGQTNYSASKAGMIGFTKSLAREISSRGVRANVIAPGFIRTDMTDKLSDEQKEALQEQIPLGRIGDSSEIADAAVFLASDMSSYITGQVLEVTGGLGM
ncbi:3-oxoacyl-[acyl-carrier-protein] reductase [Spirochaeta africana]|uniref:3-oxoacyl-[acyl-carrier-protein] reductase n=1 Tax=Spirochaeta africana (strain ATCC 700263 / DSM 8902 / Z-7692) TaxID=889378 RepID=H9UFR3_SPIAZ|nr:3-oxoacyl-[acyl-carrier-protein] reductase [Spirochaeta africana]AFG36356.1 3-oxoacyl-(acyl-carrier-protein) reductase [Spirochaeta africana DSM 8902]